MATQQECNCTKPKPLVSVTLHCKAEVVDKHLKPQLNSVQLDSQVLCESCRLAIVIEGCSFGVLRDIVHRVCASCVLKDGDIEFDTDTHSCSRTPIVGGPVYVKATGKYI